MNKEKIVKLLLDCSIGTVTLYSGIKLGNNYKLQKHQEKYKKIVIRKTPIIGDEGINLDINYLENLPISKDILNFISVLSKEFDDRIFINLYRNLSSIEIKLKRYGLINLVFGIKEVGYYLPEYNEMVIIQTKNKNTSNHELFHVSSTMIDDEGNVFSGFSQSIQNEELIGFGIDEGYTELLTKRYFGNDDEDEFYFFEVLFISLLEEIIGKEKMEQLYFQSNLYGLVMELKKYSSEIEIMEFIQKLDFYNNINSNIKENFIKNYFNDIACYLFKIFYVKQLLENKIIDIKKIHEFSKKLMKEVYFYDRKNKNKFYYFNVEDEIRIMNDVYKEFVLRKKING